uniref:Uncharacterized protein n=1 Tax=Pavo cristatus TaxID=9049 RepID=A0A8C9F786_PAVCR
MAAVGAVMGLGNADFSDLREIKKQLLSVAERSRERGLQHRPPSWPSPWNTRSPLGSLCQCFATHSMKALPDVYRDSFVSVCTCSLSSCHWTALRRALLIPLCTFPLGICVH